MLFHTLFNEWKVTIARLYNIASIMLHKIFFFFFAFHLMCLEGGVLSSLEEKKKKKTKFEEVAVFLFPLVCVRHQVLGRFPPLVSIPSVLKYERPYFFVVFGNGHPSRFKTVMALMVVVVVQALPIYLSVLFFAFFSLVMRV